MTVPVHRFVFVGGLHRSGTSMLAQALAGHSAVSGLTGTGVPEDEGQHLQNVFPTAMAVGGPGRFGFAEQAHLTARFASRVVDGRARLLAAWSPYWDLGKPVLLEKSPPNLLRSRLLQTWFPRALFVDIVRHPAVVAMATAKWNSDGVRSLVAHWVRCHQMLLKDAPYVKRLVVIRYEDLIRMPAACIQAVWRLLGLPPEPIQIEVADNLNDGYLKRWEAQARQGFEIDSIREFEPFVRRFGYSLGQPREVVGVRTSIARLMVSEPAPDQRVIRGLRANTEKKLGR